MDSMVDPSGDFMFE
jgi:hypothetical protein